MSVTRGRRSKGKAEKGILGMREARGAHEEAGPLKIHLCLYFNVRF